jgi:catechol 2,3-dioxygenase-like lactoylglutathione lyase family enzyme
LPRSIAFYDAVLGALGYARVWSEPRPEYGANYFAAFVIDPDGYRIEAVFTGQEPARRMENES